MTTNTTTPDAAAVECPIARYAMCVAGIFCAQRGD